MEFLTNAPTTHSFASCLDEVRKRVAVGDTESFLYIAPNRRAQKQIEHDLVTELGGKAVGALPILTLPDLTNALGSAAYPQLRLLSDAESAVFIEQSIRDLLAAGQLKYFETQRAREDEQTGRSAFPIPRGTFELVVSTLRKIEEKGTSPSELASEIKEAAKKKGDRTEIRRARDMQAIYQAYHARLGMAFADTYSLVLRLNNRYDPSFSAEAPLHIRRDMQALYPNATDIFIEGFSRLETPTVHLLRALCSLNLNVHISLDYDPSNPELFAPMIALSDRLRASGWKYQSIVASDNESAARQLGSILFNSDIGEIPKCEVAIELATAPDPYQEVEEIAKSIKRLCESNAAVGADLSRITVATPLPEDYTSLFHEIFRRHEIPVFVADRFHLDRSPLLISLLALMDVAEFGLRKREVLRALSSPYFRFVGSSGEPIDTSNLLEIVSRYNLSGNLKGWISGLRLELEKIKREELEDPGFLIRRVEADVSSIERAIADLKDLQLMLAPLNVEMTPKAFCNTLRMLLAKLGVREQIVASSSSTIAAGSLELDGRAYRALLALVEDLESLFHLMNIDEARLPIGYYVARLKGGAIYTRFNPRVRTGAVLITSLEQASTLESDYLFLGGLVEGALPRAYEPQIFLMQSMQEGAERQTSEERLLFYHGLSSAKKKVILSYPLRSLSGAAQTPSKFIDALREVADIREIKPDDHEPALYSYRDVYNEVSRLEKADEDGHLKLVASEARIPPTSFYAEALRVHFPRTIVAERLRMKPDDSIYRGAVGEGQLTEAEQKELEENAKRVWSVTQLERYASCAFSFFADQVLKLRTAEENEDGLDARERGTLMHEVLREFLTSRRDKKPIGELDSVEFEAAYDDVVAIAESHFGSAANGHPFWRLDSERMADNAKTRQGPLRKFIEHEKKLADYHPKPMFFETSFGGRGGRTGTESENDQILSRDAAVEIEGILLRGKIDRIDVDLKGKQFTVIDYKTGTNTPNRNQIDRGVSLQLPLYLRVAEDLLRSHLYELTGVAALYHKVLDPKADRKLGLAVKNYIEVAFEKIGNNRNRGLVESEEELKAVIDRAVSHTKEYVAGISTGKFPLVANDLLETCNYCSYRTVCRVQQAVELELLHAPPESMNALADLTSSVS